MAAGTLRHSVVLGQADGANADEKPLREVRRKARVREREQGRCHMAGFEDGGGTKSGAWSAEMGADTRS